MVIPFLCLVLLYPHNVETWYDYDNEWLVVCDAVWRLEGESKGADGEVRLAEENNIPVFHRIWDIRLWIEGRTK